MAEFRMPSLGADMEAGTLAEWRVRPGDGVKRGDIVAVVDTEKAAIEVEIFEDGIVQAILVREGEKVLVGTVLAMIRNEGQPEQPIPPQEVKAEKGAPSAPRPTAAARVPQAPMAALRGLRVSPLARRRAEELGVQLTAVTGTGEGGAITKEDVDRAAATAVRPVQAAPPAEERQAGLRRVIAAAMARSKREIPHYYLGTDIDMSQAMAWLAAENLKRPVTERLLYSALLLRTVALAAREVQEMNGFWVDGSFKPGPAIHVGVAISLRQGGLVAPAIHDVDKKSLDELMRDMLDLVKRARAGVLRSSELSDPTITVTSLGEQGVQTVFGVIYPPQVALVGFGRITERPWAAAGVVGARPVISASLSADHRVSDGHRGGLFLAAIGRLLQEPEKL
ncbi:MAG: branched-chain alpha-keto acid dehydrogenase subunit E2 [Deltaproteobacteria bacterium RIFCSPLOWO2_12_FULL_57_22]|nr:MAG: branched-chain alpha-keto acid dehydrogenase subunit E2 [Deltaproteobacteria bacterium RIFCSPLOWO2_12_FULL_57_22]